MSKRVRHISDLNNGVRTWSHSSGRDKLKRNQSKHLGDVQPMTREKFEEFSDLVDHLRAIGTDIPEMDDTRRHRVRAFWEKFKKDIKAASLAGLAVAPLGAGAVATEMVHEDQPVIGDVLVWADDLLHDVPTKSGEPIIPLMRIDLPEDEWGDTLGLRVEAASAELQSEFDGTLKALELPENLKPDTIEAADGALRNATRRFITEIREGKEGMDDIVRDGKVDVNKLNRRFQTIVKEELTEVLEKGSDVTNIAVPDWIVPSLGGIVAFFANGATNGVEGLIDYGGGVAGDLIEEQLIPAITEVSLIARTELSNLLETLFDALDGSLQEMVPPQLVTNFAQPGVDLVKDVVTHTVSAAEDAANKAAEEAEYLGFDLLSSLLLGGAMGFLAPIPLFIPGLLKAGAFGRKPPPGFAVVDEKPAAGAGPNPEPKIPPEPVAEPEPVVAATPPPVTLPLPGRLALAAPPPGPLPVLWTGHVARSGVTLPEPLAIGAVKKGEVALRSLPVIARDEDYEVVNIGEIRHTPVRQAALSSGSQATDADDEIIEAEVIGESENWDEFHPVGALGAGPSVVEAAPEPSVDSSATSPEELIEELTGSAREVSSRTGPVTRAAVDAALNTVEGVGSEILRVGGETLRDVHGQIADSIATEGIPSIPRWSEVGKTTVSALTRSFGRMREQFRASGIGAARHAYADLRTAVRTNVRDAVAVAQAEDAQLKEAPQGAGEVKSRLSNFFQRVTVGLNTFVKTTTESVKRIAKERFASIFSFNGGDTSSVSANDSSSSSSSGGRRDPGLDELLKRHPGGG